MILLKDAGLARVQNAMRYTEHEFQKLEFLRDMVVEPASDLEAAIRSEDNIAAADSALNLLSLIEAMQNKISELGDEMVNLSINLDKELERMQKIITHFNLDNPGTDPDETAASSE